MVTQLLINCQISMSLACVFCKSNRLLFHTNQDGSEEWNLTIINVGRVSITGRLIYAECLWPSQFRATASQDD